jgi:uncharacterized low-complexity protein
MQRMMKSALVAGAIAVAAAGIGTAAVGAASNDDQEAPITGTALQQASEAALAHTGEGRVTDTEVGDEDSYYEIEVTLDNGSQVDVQLDRSLHVVDTSADREGDEGNHDS